MERRALLAAAGATGLLSTVQGISARLDVLAGLPRTARMPVVFVGHGSPMNAIEDTPWRRAWQELGSQFGARFPRPQLILSISAHWVTRGWWLTGAQQPPTIHDFGGFPKALFEQRYPAPGHPPAARGIAASVASTKLQLDHSKWGFDHGTWSVLKPMFPKADIPLLQLSLDYTRPLQEHLALGRELAKLRHHGVLILGSGNVVHNLHATRRGTSVMQGHDWALEFDGHAKSLIDKGDHEALARVRMLGEVTRLAHPTHEHYLPLLHASGATDSTDRPTYFAEGFHNASISMRSVAWT